MTDIAESLFQSIDIISKNQLKSLAFDTTVEATIIDASRAQDGIYTVSTGNSNFLAYSTETGYKENDAVMVTVPQGDYNKQKMIIGKQVDNTNTPMIYKSPFQQLINVSNNLISGEHEVAMWANGGEDYGWDENITNFWESDAFKKEAEKTVIESTNNDNDDNPYSSETITFKKALIWDSKDLSPTGEEMFESRYTRLGVKAQFSTWLNEYNTAYGNYGLAIVLIFSNNDLSSDPPGRFGKVITFDSSEFFGDVYNFETFYTQEALFDISEFIDYPIRRIQLYAYQRNNFKNADGELIYPIGEVDSSDKWFSDIQPNIFIKDPYICLGMPVSDFNADIATIISGSSSTYYKLTTPGENNTNIEQRTKNNIKELQLRWIHKNAESGTIATVQANELPKDYSIQWYRYKLGAPSPDIFAGAHWERFYGCKTTPNENEEYCLTQEDIDNHAEDIATDQVEVLFYPNVNKSSEQLKAIIVKKESSFDLSSSEPTKRMIATTPIIEFTNQTDVSSQATLIDENALSIKFEDDEKGNYFLYDRAGNISKEEDKEIRVLTAVFDLKQNDIYKKPVLTQPYTSIKWIFPANNSMIIPATSQDINANPLDINNLPSGVSYNNETDSYEFLFEQNENEKQDANIISVGYFINSHLNHNANRNIVYLEINKDGQLYTAQAQMLFGTAGSSGSDYTLIVMWDNGENAFDIHKGSLSGQVYLFDQSGKIVDIDENSQYNFSWYKTKTADNEDNNPKHPILESNEKLRYPIKNSALDKLLDLNGSAIEVSYFANDISCFDNTVYYSRDDTVFKYDLQEKKFIESSYDGSKLLYSKTKNNPGRYKLDFVPVDKVITNDDSKAGCIGVDSNAHKRVYYYSDIHRAFIKYNDTYIIDPWDKYQENETYYEPVYSSNKDQSSNASLNITQNSNNKGHFTITCNTNDHDQLNNIISDELYILQVALTNFGDYDLIARFPIPMKNSDYTHNEEGKNKYYTVDFIEGPTDVRYSTTGETDFNKNPYSIQFKLLKKEQGKNLTYKKITEKEKDENENNNIGHWELIYESTNEENATFLPQLIEYEIINNKKEEKTSHFINPLLQPPGIYFEDTPIYGIKYVLDYNILFNEIFNENDQLETISTEYTSGNIIESGKNAETKYYIKKDTVLWSQPIYSYQDNYPSTTLNKWNGKDIITEEKTGIITANGFSAGKKERDNTFTGVILGDWSRSDTDAMITKQTGIYGFNHGAMSYALKDDGTAFFGKDGKGRIYFNGNNAQIYSAQWVALLKDSNNNPVLNSAGNYQQQRYGLMIDVDNGILDSRGKDCRKTYLAPGVFKITGKNPDPLFQQSDEQTILEVSDSTYILRSANYYEGQIYTSQNGYLDGRGLQIDLNNGKIQGYDFTLKAGTRGTQNKQIIINTEDKDYPFKIGNNFSVQWNGSIKSSLGIIGGWHISEGRLSSSSDSTNNNAVYLAAGSGVGNSNNPNIHGAYIKGGTIEGSTIKVGTPGNNEYPFEVKSSGALRATSGTIGDWVIYKGLLKSEDGNVSLSPTNGINLNNLFIVTAGGQLTATNGTIGGWTINSNTLTGGEVTLNSNGTISGGSIIGSSISSTSDGGSINMGNNFKVTKTGDVTISGSLTVGSRVGNNATYSEIYIGKSNGILEANQVYTNYISSNQIYSSEIKSPFGAGGHITLNGLANGILENRPSGGSAPSSYLLKTQVIPWRNGIGISLESVSANTKYIKFEHIGLKMKSTNAPADRPYGYFRLAKAVLNSVEVYVFEKINDVWYPD